MINKRVLIVASYPVSDARHGGQKRVKAILDFYKTIFSDVRFTAVYHRSYYQDEGPDSYLLGQPDIIKELDAMPYASELITAEAIDKDIHVRSAVGQLLIDYQPDIIQIEQGFAYLGLRAVLRDLGMKPKIIFSSQNIEHIMKEGIYTELGVPRKTKEKLIKKIRYLERELCQAADLVIAVSQQDAEVLRELGAKSVVVTPNGIHKVKPPMSELEYWRKFKVNKKIMRAVTYIGSGHPPNWIGFLNMVGLDTSFMPSDSGLLIAGGIADYFKATYKKQDNQKFWSRLVAIGELSDKRLSALLNESEVLLLPITSGGGSNLKTAEAILSRKKIVSTNYAFRGFEKYKKLPNIYFADDKDKFNASILEALGSTYVEPSNSEVALSEQVQWQYCLKPLLPELKKLSRRADLSRAWYIAKRPGRVAKRYIRNLSD